jgi:hypothetical protein
MSHLNTFTSQGCQKFVKTLRRKLSAALDQRRETGCADLCMQNRL